MVEEHLSPVRQKQLVRAGYDQVSLAYRADDFDYESSGYRPALELVLPGLSPSDRVLELGCGNGVPVTQRLARRSRVVGLDFSGVQLGRARMLVPGADFVLADMASFHFPSSRFAGVVAFYSLIHVPLDDQPRLLRSIWGWLIPGGFFLGTVGFSDWIGSEENWCGVPGATMYWSHRDRQTNRAWFEEAGFELEQEMFIPEGAGGATVLLARKPAG